MPFKLNPLTGQLDLVNSSSSGSGNVTGVPPTDVNAIARWDDTTGTTIKNSKASVQDGGAIQTQGILQKRDIVDDVTVPDNYVWIDQDINVTTGNVTLQGDGEITLVD